ncbi:unnamed protein product [Lactuca saligna]|uniref:Uncharacterized protein n=1 Tax=Lactuca saligna TaxID=75948 RepID=A0AA35Z7K9_LACSI|nr:unnamed protein product [Lactuca saligna]
MIFSYNTNITKGPYAPDSTIIIQSTNVAFLDEISKQFTNSGIEDFVNYVKSCPLRYAFYDFLDPFYPKQVWYNFHLLGLTRDPYKNTLRQEGLIHEYMFIPEPEHKIFYLDSQNQMCFQRTDDLPSAPTEHLFHLRLEGLGHYELERGYCELISLELSRRLDELKLDQFR